MSAVFQTALNKNGLAALSVMATSGAIREKSATCASISASGAPVVAGIGFDAFAIV